MNEEDDRVVQILAADADPLVDPTDAGPPNPVPMTAGNFGHSDEARKFGGTVLDFWRGTDNPCHSRRSP